MEELVGMVAALVGMAVVFGPALVGGVGVMVLRGQVRRLEARIAVLERAGAPATNVLASAEPPPPEVSPVSPTATPATPVHVAQARRDAPLAGEPVPPDEGPPAVVIPATASRPPVPVPTPPAPRPRLSPERLAMRGMGVVGGVLVLLGVLLIFALAIEVGMFGPRVRVLAGLGFGTTTWLWGAAWHRRSPYGASALVGVGLGSLYASVFSAASLYALVPAGVALVAAFGITLGALAYGARRDQPLTAHLGTFGGLMAPLVLSSGGRHTTVLFAYLAVLTVGAVVAAERRRWWTLPMLAAAGDFLLFVGWGADLPGLAGGRRAELAQGLVWGAVLVAPLVASACWPRGEDAPARHLRASAGLAAACLPWSWLVLTVERDHAGGWLLGLVFVFVGLPGWFLGQRHRAPHLVLVGLAGAGLAGCAVAWNTRPETSLALPVATLVVAGLVTALGTRPRHRVGMFDLWPWAVAVPAAVGVAAVDGAVSLQSAALVGVAVLALAGRWADAGWRVVHAGLGMSLGLVFLVAEGGLAGPVTALAFLVLAVVSWGPMALTGGPTWTVSRWAGVLTPPWTVGLMAASAGAFDGLPWALVGSHTLAVLLALVWLRGERPEGVLAGGYLVVGLSVLSVALPMELETRWLTVAVALACGALGLATTRVANPVLPVFSALAGGTVGVRLLLNPVALTYGDASGWPLINWTLYTWGLPALALGAAAWGLARGALGTREPVRLTAGALLVTALWLGFALINVEISHAFQAEGPLELWSDHLFPAMVRSVAWGLYGVALLVAGMAQQRRLVRLVGFGFLLLGTVKVFAVDLWSLSGLVRIGSVLGLGASLLVATFLFERLVIRGARGRDGR